MKEAWKVLEFDRILTTLSTCAVSAEAQAALLALTPSADEVQCLHRMAETTEARRMLEQCGTPPFSLMENLTQHIALAQAGGMLTPEQLTGVAQFAASCRRLTQYLRRGVDASPMLSAYAGELHDVSALAEAIDAEDKDACNAQFAEILAEQTALKKQKEEILQGSADADRVCTRMKQAEQAIENTAQTITEWSENAVRQIVERVTVLSTDEILVRIKGGAEIKQRLER